MTANNYWKHLFVAALVLGSGLWISAQEPNPSQRRERAIKAMQAGNIKNAYEDFRKLALDPKGDALKVGTDLVQGLQCLQQLGRQNEMDEFREGVIAAHAKNWRLLSEAAKTYNQGNFEHYGYIVAGKFERGNHRGGGRFVQSFDRDRVRALQLMDQALALTKADNDKIAVANFHRLYADMLLSGDQGNNAWRLQFLSDLSKLPDYDESGANPYMGRGFRGGIYGGRGQNHSGAPVDADGKPVYYSIPKSYEAAANDGERWRWNLLQVAELQPNRLSEVDMVWGHFLQSQFGEQTMAEFGFFGEGADDKTGTFALASLKDNETIARLATGVRRFEMPDEFNYITVFKRVADRGKSVQGENALGDLASVYENRRQYPTAAATWTRAIKDYGPGQNNFRQERLDQIVKNWGRFEPIQMQPDGKAAVVDFRFRNGNKVTFEAFSVNVPKLLADVKQYLTGRQGHPDYQQIDISNIGHRLVDLNQNQYIIGKVATWDMDLKPRPNHIDERVTVKTPLEKPGAYLLTAKMAGGNVGRVIVWVTDTVLIKRQLEGQTYLYAADAVTGSPVPNAKFDFFGWKQVQVKPNTNQWRIDTVNFSMVGDKDGQLFVPQAKQPQDLQWLIVARKNDKAPPSDMTRFAYLGFTHVWFGNRHDPEYNQTRVFAMTDRPVYRPDQAVQYKFWVRHAKYDQADTSSFAGQTFTLEISNPKGEKILEKAFVADEFGGFSGDLILPRGATLGQYNMHLKNVGWQHAGNTFRVEEYKKPEFQVKVDAPTEPVKLGDKIPVTIDARYYFGAPVTRATVKYKVTRTPHSATWYPRGAWDWFYGPGYWWFAPAYAWYPGWSDWGCLPPVPFWWHQPAPQPELVMENTVPVGPDGKVIFEIDSAVAKELHGNQDHAYAVTAEVVDESRRTIVGNGNVLVARKPFKIYSWLDRGHYRSGDVVLARFSAQTLDRKPVEGGGAMTLYAVSYDDKNQPVEKVVDRWDVATNVEGYARQQFKPAQPGQYRIVYKLTDKKNNTVEGATVFLVRGDGYTAKDARFNDLELIAEKREYNPGEKVKLLINTNRSGGTVLFFPRPTNNVYLPPKIIRLSGKSTEEEVAIVQKDMPNIFVEAVTVSNGKVYNEVREIVVPPEKRVLNVEVLANHQEYKPGEEATVKVKLTEANGEPFVGSTVLTVYDKSVEYISGGSNVPEIKEYFWKWRRRHNPQMETNVNHFFHNLLRPKERGMGDLGIYGATVIEERLNEMKLGRMEPANLTIYARAEEIRAVGFGGGLGGAPGMPMAPMAAAAPADAALRRDANGRGADHDPDAGGAGGLGQPDGAGLLEPSVRKNFIDTAYWNATLTTAKDGTAQVSFKLPEQLTSWKLRVWGMGHGTKVGQGEAEVVTKKDLIVRLQAPRFFVQKDEVVLSANVHNYLKSEKRVRVSLEMDGGTLGALQNFSHRDVVIPAGGEQRVDWRVKVVNEGEAIVRMKAQTDTDADAMEMRFPCYIHGMLKMESFAGVIRPEGSEGKVLFSVPAERRIEQSRLEVRYSPTLAGAMVDALPYMVDFPYGCTEQTLNRFVPTVITQKILRDMKIDLAEVEKHQTNLNAQEIGDDKERMKQWKRFKRNPVFNVQDVETMTQAGVDALAQMQITDGGWGWFSGWGERSWPHTTATVVHGLQLAKANGVKLPQNVLERGETWLRNYQDEQVRRLHNWASKTEPYKPFADNIDAFVYMVLVDAGVQHDDMRDFLYRDRTQISVYAKAMFGLALHKNQQADKLAMIMENIRQFAVEDPENQTAYLKLPADNPWWNWYGSEIEADAYYLKLLSRTNPRDTKAAGLVKYLLNNRKHATYWNSTRDTAICIEAMAEYLKASGEGTPDMTVEVWLDGKKSKEVAINPKNLFTFDNKLVLTGDSIAAGKHTLELKRKGSGPVYYNAYVTNFTLEDDIKKAGLEVRVDRKYYKLIPIVDKVKVSGSRGQALDQKVQKYERQPLSNLAELKSGDLVEIELEIQSKNDYEYLIFEDMKPAGFEPMDLQSGYTKNDMGAYCEYRDEKVVFFVRALARGEHSLRYRMRAETPGQFSALPTRAAAMYAPELRGNSDEIKLRVTD
jgi:uncharacterized protein YfaS (alpha-2-macroglobulin family)